ncbi:MAG: sigma-54 interaction domain-containing protein [Sphaerochaetaceae bacterium]
MDVVITTETILESISDGVFTVDADWNITSFNRAAEKITGIDRKHAIGLRCSEVFKSNMCENQCPLVKTFATNEPIINRTGYIVDLCGKRIPISVSTALLMDSMGKVIGGAETFRDLSELEELRKLRARKRLGDIASNSPAMHKVMDMVPAVAQSSSTVLIMGETGTGKEVLARTIHACSQRKDGPFIAVNCGSLPDSLLESELFGYKKGAFTGADKDKPGRFHLAQNGTLFLDEIGEISPAMQVKLLRVLQEQEYEPLGAVKTEKTNARIICATNRNLEKMVAQGDFRQDFYYRIHIIPITVPPLRDRREDIPLLAAEFLQQYGILNNKTVSGFSPEVFVRFYAYQWPGNVRELENVIERAVVLCSSQTIGLVNLPAELNQVHNFSENLQPGSSQESMGVFSDIHNAKRQTERQYIEDSLVRNHYRIPATAAELGWHRATLYRKIKALSIHMHA